MRRSSVLRLLTMRGDSQFNTTVYSLDDRFRGVFGTRRVLLIRRDDITRLGCEDGEIVTVAHDGFDRHVEGLRLTAFDLPPGCVAGYCTVQ